jgi:uncharacterized protein (DUF4415 family)
MNEADAVRAVVVDGQAYQKMPDGTLAPIRDKTDDARLNGMNDNEVEAIAASDADGPPMTDEEWAKREVTSPGKVSVGLRLDSDVLQWFKAEGRGYQPRINAVLRRYMDAHRKAG